MKNAKWRDHFVQKSVGLLLTWPPRANVLSAVQACVRSLSIGERASDQSADGAAHMHQLDLEEEPSSRQSKQVCSCNKHPVHRLSVD